MSTYRLWGLSAAAIVGLWVVIPSTGCGGSNSATTGPGDDASVSDGSDDGASDGPYVRMCGNGIQDPGEQCDQGAQNGTGMGCEKNCMWTCTTGMPLTNCDNAPCVTAPKCTAMHTCQNGTPIPTGGSCGKGMVCNSMGNCISTKCGDGIVESGEECDNGAANGPGTGCESDCHFTCGGDDPTVHNCNSPDPCTSNGTCMTATHKCTPGTAVANGTTCTTSTVTGGICKSGKCTAASCGDGVVEAGEQCDFGAGNGPGTGCETNCMFSCPTLAQTTGCTQPSDSCAGPNTCSGVTMGTEMGQKCVQGSPLADGSACGTGGHCMSGVCKTANCGNGTLETGEQCDFGTAENGQGLGCGASCQFDCEKSPTDTCTTGVDPCTATPKACAAVVTTFGTLNGQTCQASTPIPACGACNGTEVCGSIPGHVCSPAHCGDGCIESGEQCDPPSSTCSATCQNIICGDGVREGTEQCDDGNTQNLDGCDYQCHFEQIQRANKITMEFTAAGCPCGANALGRAIGTTAQGQVTGPINTSITNGTANILFEFLGITDLTGTNQSSGLTLGALSGLPPTYTGSANGNNDLDWWYVMDSTTVMKDANGHWVTKSTPLAATFTGGAMAASGSLNLELVLAGMMTSQIHMSAAQLAGSTGTANAPTKSGATMTSPGHLASEHLDPTLVSFSTMSNGSLCGNVAAASLANIPLTTSITGLCTSYTTSDSFLDLIVGGCLGFLGGVTATQPDKTDPMQPVWGAGAPYTFQETGNHVVSCKDKSGTQTTTAAQLATCEAAAAYSSWFLFTSDRVIVHNQ